MSEPRYDVNIGNGGVQVKVQESDLALPKEITIPFPIWWGVTVTLLQGLAARPGVSSIITPGAEGGPRGD